MTIISKNSTLKEIIEPFLGGLARCVSEKPIFTVLDLLKRSLLPVPTENL